VIGGVLGRAGEAGKLHRLTLATQKQYSFQPALNLHTPGHLNASDNKKYPKVLKLGGTVQELEEQDRGIVHDYNIDVEPPEGAFDKKLEVLKRQFLKGMGEREVERERKVVEASFGRASQEAATQEDEVKESHVEKKLTKAALKENIERVLREKATADTNDTRAQRSGGKKT
jgi:hypothetical protein